MNIEELSEFIYEDLNARITCVDRSGEKDTRISVAFDNPRDERLRRVIITCVGTIEATVTPSWFESLQIQDQHPVLLDHIDDFGYLSFSSPPRSPEEVIGRIYEAHYLVMSDWRTLSSYLNHLTREGVSQLLKGGRGMIARGPYSVLEAYDRSISDLLTTSLIRTARKPQSGLRLLLFGSEFVVAESFHCHEET